LTSFQLDAGFLDDRPPLLGIRFHQRAGRFRRLRGGLTGFRWRSTHPTAASSTELRAA
jgi:hypothetical protein